MSAAAPPVPAVPPVLPAPLIPDGPATAGGPRWVSIAGNAVVVRALGVAAGVSVPAAAVRALVRDPVLLADLRL